MLIKTAVPAITHLLQGSSGGTIGVWGGVRRGMGRRVFMGGGVPQGATLDHPSAPHPEEEAV